MNPPRRLSHRIRRESLDSKQSGHSPFRINPEGKTLHWNSSSHARRRNSFIERETCRRRNSSIERENGRRRNSYIGGENHRRRNNSYIGAENCQRRNSYTTEKELEPIGGTQTEANTKHTLFRVKARLRRKASWGGPTRHDTLQSRE